jgi:DNA-binding MarR family transcriptional regulator
MASTDDRMLTSAGYLLLKAGVQFGAVVDEVMTAEGLTGRGFLVLTFVGGPDVLSQQELSRRLGIDPTVVVRLIDDLEDRDLVRRVRDPDDRRRHLLELTEAGRATQRRASAAITGAERDFLAPLRAADRKTLRGLLLEVMRPRLHWLTGP